MLKLIITDFDGTLVDTFRANFFAYQKAFHSVGLTLTEEQYKSCFGLRFERFMTAMGISDKSIISTIRSAKCSFYPEFFRTLQINTPLLELMTSFQHMGGLTAIASTARKENLMHVIEYLDIAHSFNLIYAGDDVLNGKPSPEIYLRTMEQLSISPSETIIFEDSDVGILAAKASGAKCIRVTSDWFNS